MPSLVLLKAPATAVPGRGFRFDFAGHAEVVVGNGRGGCHLTLLDGNMNINRKHAVFSVRDGRVCVENFGRNNTIVNGRAIDGLGPIPLADGDTVKFCDFLFRFEDDAADVPVVIGPGG